MSHVEQELLTLPDHQSSPTGFQWGSYCLIFSFLCSVLQIIVCHFVPLLLAIVLSVLLPFTSSAYPYGIVTPFFISKYTPVTLSFQTLLANYKLHLPIYTALLFQAALVYWRLHIQPLPILSSRKHLNFKISDLTICRLPRVRYHSHLNFSDQQSNVRLVVSDDTCIPKLQNQPSFALSCHPALAQQNLKTNLFPFSYFRQHLYSKAASYPTIVDFVVSDGMRISKSHCFRLVVSNGVYILNLHIQILSALFQTPLTNLNIPLLSSLSFLTTLSIASNPSCLCSVVLYGIYNGIFHSQPLYITYNDKDIGLNLLNTTRFWNNLHQVCSIQKDWKTK